MDEDRQLMEDDRELQEMWEDLDEDRFLQGMDEEGSDESGESDGDDDDDDDLPGEGDEVEGDNKGRRNRNKNRRRRNRRKRNRKGGRGKGGKGKGKGKKNMTYAEFEKAIVEKQSKIGDMIEKKCGKKAKKLEKIYKFMETEGELYAQYLDVAEEKKAAKEAKCAAQMQCKMENKIAKKTCEKQWQIKFKASTLEADEVADPAAAGFTVDGIG